jgi:hemerythrin superfamily protein
MPNVKSRAPDRDTMAAESAIKARAIAEPGDWLSFALDHHDQIRAAFEVARKALPGGGRVSAMKGLAVVLNGHSLAEEIVLYPALAALGEPNHAEEAYAEQTDAKLQMAELERVDPASVDWLEQLDRIRTAVLAHMTEEETTWFLKIKSEYDDQAKLSARFREEFERYTRTGFLSTNCA